MNRTAALFVLFLLVTVGILGFVVFTGRKARRRKHVPAVIALVISLGLAIYFAELLGEQYDVRSAGWITPVHLWTAKVTTVGYLVPIATGLWTLRHPATRRLHGRVAYAIVVLTVLTAVTGVAMLALSPTVAA